MFSYFPFLVILHLALGDIILSNNTKSSTVTVQEYTYEYILCSSCGGEITSSIGIISKPSPISDRSYHSALFDLDDVLVQMLPSGFFYLPIITTTLSTCVGVGEWEEKDTWFPGYRWKPCVCPDCGEYVGWIFEPTSSNSIDPFDKFFGLMLNTLIGQSFIDSLIVFPGESNINHGF